MDTTELSRLKQAFTNAVAGVFDTAHGVEEGAGVSAQWRQYCERYQVSLLDDTERAQVRVAQRPVRGAALMEVQDVITAVVKEYRIALKGINVWDAPREVELFHEKFLTLLERTSNEFLSAYKKAVLPKPAGMFANVFSAQQTVSQSPSSPTAVTLRCKNCSAPRLNDRDFVCAYCDEQMV